MQRLRSNVRYISLARRSDDIVAGSVPKGAVQAHSFELVLEGSRVSDRDLFGVGSLSTCCQLARARVKPSQHHPTGVSGLCLKNKCATFEKKRLLNTSKPHMMLSLSTPTPQIPLRRAASYAATRNLTNLVGHFSITR